MLREIRAQGYTGKLTVLRDFVRPLRKELILVREEGSWRIVAENVVEVE